MSIHGGREVEGGEDKEATSNLVYIFEVKGQARKRNISHGETTTVPPVTISLPPLWHPSPSPGGTLYWERRSPIGGPHPKIRNWQPMLILSSTNLIKRRKPQANGTIETPESCAQGIQSNGRGER